LNLRESPVLALVRNRPAQFHYNFSFASWKEVEEK
jgi:hypothetical protein